MSRAHHCRCQLPLSNTAALTISFSLSHCQSFLTAQHASGFGPDHYYGPPICHRVSWGPNSTTGPLSGPDDEGREAKKIKIKEDAALRMDGGLCSDCLPHHWFLLFAFFLWPPVSISDKSQPHKNLMKHIGKGVGARTHRLKACVKFGEGQVMPDIHSYHFKTPARRKKRYRKTVLGKVSD